MYCIAVWGTAAKKNTDSLFKLKKLCCGIIIVLPMTTGSKVLFTSLKILPVSKVYEYYVMMLIYRFFHGHFTKRSSNYILM